MPQTPTAQEQALLEMINRARTAPQDEASAILSDRTPAISQAIDYFDVDLSAFRQQMAQYNDVAPLAWDLDLATAADNHSRAMLEANQQTHQVPGGPDLGQRYDNVGYNGSGGENLFAFGEEMPHVHASFVIDWGNGPDGMQDPPGHRISIMNGNFSEVGISVQANDGSFGQGDWVTTQNFGRESGEPARLLGVVIDDRDGDAFYDIGEGMGNVTVTAEGNGRTQSTTTWGSGGYQMALAAGSYEVTFAGGGLDGEIVRQVTVSGENVKLDAMAGAAGSMDPTPSSRPTESDDDLTGTVGPDTISLLAGNDSYKGLAGNDTIYGNQGNDMLLGDNGGDRIEGQLGNDTVVGGNGPDTAYLNEGDDVFLDNGQGGSLGADTVFANQGDDTIQGGNGDDVFFGQIGDDEIYGRLGNDRIDGGPGADSLYGGNGNDVVIGGLGTDTAYLGAGADTFLDNGQGGPLGADTVFAEAGNDTIQGGNGDDVFHGQNGEDEIHGRLGNDTIYGGNNADRLYAGNGDDVVIGGNGPDLAYLGLGNDTFIDNAQGGSLGQDIVYALAGNDTIQGGNGADAFYGGEGDDLILSRLGNDEVYGGNGDDRITGGAGADSLTGGAGADTFAFGPGSGNDRILDFQSGLDTIEMTDLTRGDVSVSSNDNGVTIEWDSGFILLEGLASNGFADDDLAFV